jgi:hypothetical protein
MFVHLIKRVRSTVSQSDDKTPDAVDAVPNNFTRRVISWWVYLIQCLEQVVGFIEWMVGKGGS